MKGKGQPRKGLVAMFRHSLANIALLFVFAVLTVFPARAQLLTGYDVEAFDGAVEVESAPVPVASTPQSEPEFVPVFSSEVDEFSPLLTSPIDIRDVDIVASLPADKTDVYTNFLTAPDNAKISSEKQPLDLEADTMRYNEVERIVTAQGDVIIMQDGRILRADEVEYVIDQDTVRARGNVVLNEENGDVHLSQVVEYNDKLRNGNVNDLQTTLNDGSQFSAETGRRIDGKRTVMDAASYTACEPCKRADGSIKRMPWQIKASEVTHDEEAARVSYRNARFAVYGVPVAYTPYFSHPDGTIDRKSGFLSPSLGYKSKLGAFIENKYYWDVAPDKDMTFSLLAMTEQAPLGLVEYRQRWRDAGFKINGGVTYSERTDEFNGNNVKQDEEVRGHVFANMLWDMSDTWRSGVDVQYVSDEQYARQYDITDENVLKNRIYAERFSGRDYATAYAELYKDTRVSERQVDQPGVLPEIYASFIGEPGAVPLVKGRWDAKFGLLSLFRDGAEQDITRGSVDLGWERRLVSDYGLVSEVDLTLRGDAYHVNDADFTTTRNGQESNSVETRFFPQAHMQVSYPMARNFKTSQMLVEPLVSITASDRNNDNDDVPNEDSQDVQLDASNLFEPNRFPGLDVVEDQSRVTYGVRTGLNGSEASNAEFFIGQSYRFDEDDNPFQTGSGLDNRSSDVVGYLRGDYKNQYSMQYRFQLDNESLSSERHELDAEADWNRFRLRANYLYAKALAGTEITENREQASANAQYYIDERWRMMVGAQYDLGADPGLRKGVVGLDYFGQCVSWSLQGQKNLTDDSSGDSDTEILFRIGLRNISEFMRTGLRDEGNSP